MEDSPFGIQPEQSAILVDAAAYADGRADALFAELRDRNPIAFARPRGFDPFWVLTRFEDVRQVSRDAKAFPIGDMSSMLRDKASDDFIRSMAGGKPYIGRTLVTMDAPDHMKYRLLTQSWFMPKHLKTLNGQISHIASKTVDKLRYLNGRCDFVPTIALEYPLEVIMEILGVPEEDLPLMMRLTQEIFSPLDPETATNVLDNNDTAAFGKAFKATVDEIWAYFQKITEDRRLNPRNDIATIIANAEVYGKPISDDDALGYYGIVATAGHDTTGSSTSAAMYGLASQPEMFARVKADRSLLPALVEEAIRWATPVKSFMRSAAQDIELEGRSIKQGDWVMLSYASANRDEAIFPDAGKFDIDRPKSEHIAFGYGPHVCLGQHLARLEMTALLDGLLTAIKSVSLDGPVAFSHSFFVSGLKHLPIRFELEDLPPRSAA